MRYVLLLAPLVLAACQTIRSDVTRFHTLPNPGHGETILIAPIDENVEKPLEFQTYSEAIANKLRSAGYIPVQNIADAKLVALIWYGVVDRTTRHGAVPIFGQTGGGTTFHQGSVQPPFSGFPTTFSGTSYTPPTMGVLGMMPVSRDEYTHVLTMSVYEFKPEAPTASPQLFDGTVRNVGLGATFNAVSACLIDALFTDFPGRSGSTETIELTFENCGE
jgi:hypothetical protein